MIGAPDPIHEQVNQQEMTEVIGRHRDLVPLRRTLRLLQLQLVDSGIADQGVQRGWQTGNNGTNTVEITEIHQHMVQTLLGKIQRIGGSGSTLWTSVGRDHRPPLVHEGTGGIEPNP